jgi:hypothetical protein
VDGVLNSTKSSQHIDEEDIPQERRKSLDRRISDDEIRFPFIDDNCKLIMKERRTSNRRASDVKFKNPLKVVSKLFKK